MVPDASLDPSHTWAGKQQKPLQSASNYLLEDSVKLDMLANLQN